MAESMALDFLNNRDVGPILAILLISALFIVYYNGEARRVRLLSFKYVSKMADFFSLSSSNIYHQLGATCPFYHGLMRTDINFASRT